MNALGLSADNTAYVEALFEAYLANASAVSPAWQHFFQSLPPGSVQPTAETVSVQDNTALLQQAYRTFGHLMANLDPLSLTPPLSETTFNELNHVTVSATQAELLQRLRATYCHHIGFEFMYISCPEARQWWVDRIESSGQTKETAAVQRAIFEDLVAADGLERFLGTKYVGQKRFSLEGGDALIPMMRDLLDQAGQAKVREVVIGMAHRGRLNMLVNVLGKSPQSLFDAFEGKAHTAETGTGDVKYHLGFSSDVRTRLGDIVHVALAFNPSHLEIIGPVVEGSVKARLERQGDLEDRAKVLPILIHGDAAFAGQGVVMEMLNFSQARGFCTGGTVHVVINNQVGFTTSEPHDARSTHYCTDLAKMIEAPVMYVNGDDVEAVVRTMRLAFAFRQRFKRDVVIDLVCYRRHGHNEADEPAITQPVMYHQIQRMQPLRDVYGQQLVEAGLLTAEALATSYEKYRAKLDAGHCLVELVQGEYQGKVTNDWAVYEQTKWTAPAKTSLSLEQIHRLSDRLQQLPDGFTLHPVVVKLFTERRKMAAGDIAMNWGFAEMLAYASLVDEGYGLRLTGQDVGRGTFAHRHAVLHDAKTGDTYCSLTHLGSNPSRDVRVTDSLLSEEAVLAFEYGYACSDPLSLVLWEAQFGDFANGAQVVIDQFISSGEQKWGRLCGLVMLLPHGYEGQGPEHSSARLERYMQLCAQHNMQVCVPSTPAQIFHLLRRQLLRPFRKPLIVMTPKSLLRHKLAVSTLHDLTKGSFHPVIGESDAIPTHQVKRIVVCSGKVYYDLLQHRRDKKLDHVAIIRLEQLYPFPEEAFKKELLLYSHAKQVVWCQEEPQNQGAWFASMHHIRQCLHASQALSYAGRPFTASPAVGSVLIHKEQQEALVVQALAW